MTVIRASDEPDVFFLLTALFSMCVCLCVCVIRGVGVVLCDRLVY